MKRLMVIVVILTAIWMFALEKRDEPSAVAISEDGRYVALGTSDAHVWVWDIESPRLLKIFEVSSKVNSMDFTQGGKILIVGEEDGTFDVLNVETGGVAQSVRVVSVPVVKIKALKGGRYVAIVRRNGMVEVWDSNGWWRFVNMNTSFDKPDDVEVTDRYVIAVKGKVIKVWSLVSSKLINTIPLDVEIRDVDVTMGERKIVVLGTARGGSVSVSVFDLLTGVKVADLSTLPEVGKWLLALKAFPDATVLIGVGVDGTVRIWDLTSMELTESFDIGKIKLISFTDDRMMMVTADSSWGVKVWRVKGTWIEEMLNRFPGDVKDIDLLPNGILVAGYKLLSVLDFSGEEILRIRQTGYVNAASIDIESKKLMTGYKKGYVKIWNASNGEFLKALWKHDMGVLDVFIRGDRGYSISEDGEFVIWNVTKGKRVARRFLGYNLTSAAFSEDGERFVVGDVNGNVALYDIGGKLVWKREKAHDGSVSAVTVSESYVVSGDDRGNVKVWNRETGDFEMILRGKLQKITALAVDETHSSIVCADKKGNIEVWYIKGKPVDSFKMKGAVLDIEPIGDGDYLMGGWSGRLVKWHKTHLLSDITVIPGGDYMMESTKYGCAMSAGFEEKARIFYHLDETELKNCARY